MLAFQHVSQCRPIEIKFSTDGSAPANEVVVLRNAGAVMHARSFLLKIRGDVKSLLFETKAGYLEFPFHEIADASGPPNDRSAACNVGEFRMEPGPGLRNLRLVSSQSHHRG